MPLVPQTKTGALNFFQSRLAAWNGDPAAVGLTPQQVTDISAATFAAQDSLIAAQQTYNAARSATAANDSDIAAMRTVGAGVISTVRAFAKATGDAEVYALADIPAPKAPTPAGTPDAPTNTRGSIDSRGAVELRWNGSLAYHTFFEVYRMFAGQSEWTLLASVGTKAFVDVTIPPGSTSAISYYIQARRGELTSEPSAPITVRMGVVPVNTNTPEANTTNTGDNLGIAA